MSEVQTAENTASLERLIVGRVVSDVNDKTIVVMAERKIRHPKYGKYIKRSTKIHAHDPNNDARMGYLVSIKESRPYSKKKTWQLVEILERTE